MLLRDCFRGTEREKSASASDEGRRDGREKGEKDERERRIEEPRGKERLREGE